MNIFDAINLFFTSLITFSLLLLSVILFQLGRYLANQFRWQKQSQTLSAIRLSQDTEKLLMKLSSSLASRHDFKSLDSESRIDIQKLLNLFEMISLGVNRGIYDEEITKAALDYLFISVFREFRELIYTLRSEHYSFNLYTEYESLVRRWQEDKKFN